MTLYNVTDPSAALPAPFASLSGTLDESLFDTIAIGDKQEARVDEIRFGLTYTDVAGPPATDTEPPTLVPADIVDDRSGTPVPSGAIVHLLHHLQ